MTALALILASVLALLYVRTQSHDESGYFSNVALIRQMKQLDAQWELNVLRSRMGIELSYDSLVDPVAEINRLQSSLQTILTDRHGTAANALTGTSVAFQRAVVDKVRLVERFKSHNSVLRNSLAFLPTATDDLQRAIGTGSPGSDQTALRRLAAEVNQTLLDTEIYSHSPSDDTQADIKGDLERLAAAAVGQPAALDGALQIFTAHVRTVLREQPEVNSLLKSIASVPTDARLDELDNALGSEQRELALQAQKYRKYLLMFSAALAALLLYAAVRVIRSNAIIHRFNRDLRAANESLEQRVQERTGELRAAQSELVTTARQAGMAEIATNVLHNVGNVLNSVNVSAELIAGRIRESKARSLADAVQLMNEHAADLGKFLTLDEKGRRLPGYLNKLASVLATEQQAITAELTSLTKSIDHIKDVVAMQQSYAVTTRIIDPVQVRELVEDALRMNQESMAQRQIAVVKEFADVPPVLLDKHSMLQILVNLIANARQALDSVTDRPRRMMLGVDVAGVDPDRRLLVRVADNGEGIAAENLSRLFVHGFTTRQNGHGFGLHSCALAAKNMRGKLMAHSDGPGKGAMFTLELPMNAAETT